MRQKLQKEWSEFLLLIRSIPAVTLTLFVMSVFSMNLLANKSISLPFSWLALDCGLIVSWFAFLTMDVITRHFGPKAATEISVLAIGCNLIFCALFYAGSQIPGAWGESYVPGSEALLNAADSSLMEYIPDKTAVIFCFGYAFTSLWKRRASPTDLSCM